jgi:Reverse transcriptase (RNA-dependent DNA polymerase)
MFKKFLDLKKSFDRVNHFILLTSLIRAGMPKWVILVFVNRYSCLSFEVKWNGVLSRSFVVQSGVHQGGVISPALFNVFTNSFIANLRKLPHCLSLIC